MPSNEALLAQRPTTSPPGHQMGDDSLDYGRGEERVLVARLRSGDISAFTALVSYHIRRLTSFATWLLGSADSAEDCVQGVLVHLWDHRASIDPDRPLRPYLIRAVQNQVLRERRAEGVREKYRRAQRQLASERTVGGNPEDAILTGAMVQDAMAQLSERRQLALRLWLEMGLTDPEIAETLGISLQAADRLIRRALSDVRDLLLVSKNQGDTRT